MLGTIYKALSAEASTAYGLSPVFIVHDELGQVKGPDSELYEALETATAGQESPHWDRSGMGRNHFAVIPNATHYDIINTTAVSEIAIPFLGGYTQTAATPQ